MRQERVCSICNWEGEKFLPCNPHFSHDESRKISGECKCPVCDSRSRHRAVMLLLKRLDLPVANQRILHVAPENFLVSYFGTKRPLQHEKIDKYVDQYPKNTVTEMDLVDVKFADHSFDFAFCAHVLEHIPDDNKAIRELYRILVPGGIAVLMVPIYPIEKTADLYDKGPDSMGHVHQPGSDYFKRYKAAGFAVNIYNLDKLYDPIQYGLRIGWDQIAVCHKPKNRITGLFRRLRYL
jgi:SAM-dependent methyltransferase